MLRGLLELLKSAVFFRKNRDALELTPLFTKAIAMKKNVPVMAAAMY
jgi:hypothetical protein